MFLNFLVVKVNSDYCDYLRNFDNKVPLNKDNKLNRPFIGILFTIHDMEYFAPLSSPKAKHLKMHNNIDFVKLDNGKLGAVNFNNMIPVNKNNYKKIKFNYNDKKERKYINLIKKQLNWLNENKIQIIYKADNLYALYLANLLPLNIKQRCCNFKLLEEKCEEYNQNLINV